MDLQSKKIGLLLSLSAAMMFAISPVFMKLSLDAVNPETLIVLQSLFASILYVVLFFFSGRPTYFRAVFRNWRKFALLGLLSVSQGLLFAFGILISGPTNAVFILQFNFVFTITFGVLFLKEGFSRYEGLGVLVAVIGVFILSYGNIALEISGTIVLLSASLLIALTNLIAKVYVKNINPIALSGGKALFIMMFISAYSLVLGKLQTSILPSTFVYTFLSAMTGAFFGFFLFYRALQIYDVSKAIVVRTLEPFLTALWSFAFLSALPNTVQLFGGVLIITGVVTLALAKEKAR
jgi:drug/metabolite transporter (DMT)-like permease